MLEKASRQKGLHTDADHIKSRLRQLVGAKDPKETRQAAPHRDRDWISARNDAFVLISENNAEAILSLPYKKIFSMSPAPIMFISSPNVIPAVFCSPIRSR